MNERPSLRLIVFLCLVLGSSPGLAQEPSPTPAAGFKQEEILKKAEGFFGGTTEGLARAIEKVFAEQGEPNALIIGEEISGAIVVGARYGQGKLEMRDGSTRQLYWQGPSIGLDTGGNASKVMALIYNLKDPETLYQRYPGVDGSLYFIAGASVNYLRSGNVTIAPIRTGVGARAGVSVGYLHFTKEKSWVPF